MSIRIVKRLAIREAEVIFAQEISAAMVNLRTKVPEAVRSRMREFEGKEKANVKAKVTGSLFRKVLTVSGDLPQTMVDEYGRRKGVKVERFKQYERRDGSRQFRRVIFYTGMPPTGPGTPLRRWAKAKGIGNLFLLARAIARDGIEPTRPFQRTVDEETPMIVKELNDAVERGVKRLNT